jgi:hypothetical protein
MPGFWQRRTHLAHVVVDWIYLQILVVIKAQAQLQHLCRQIRA